MIEELKMLVPLIEGLAGAGIWAFFGYMGFKLIEGLIWIALLGGITRAIYLLILASIRPPITELKTYRELPGEGRDYCLMADPASIDRLFVAVAKLDVSRGRVGSGAINAAIKRLEASPS